MKRLIYICIVLVLLISFLPVNAEVFGGKWGSSPIYYVSTSNPYYSNVITAAGRWNSPLVFYSTGITIQSGSALSAVVSITTYAYGNTGWSGQGSSGPNLYSGTYSYGTMKLNSTYLSSYSSSKRTAICVHEWGHILGFAHHGSYFDYDWSIMYTGGAGTYYDVWGVEAPTEYDESVLDNLY